MAGWQLQDWETDMRARHQRETTVRLRLSHVRRFARGHPDPWAVTSGDVVEHLARCRSPEYAKSVRSSLSGYFTWAIRCDLTRYDPTVKAPRVQVPRPEARPCPEAVYKRALLAAPADLELAVRLMGETGLRCMEVAGLHTRDITAGGVRVVGKGGHPRTVPVSGHVMGLLRRVEPGWVFPGRFPGEHTRPGTLGRRVAVLLGDGWTAHTLRHRCGTLAYGRTADLIAVQRLLGHASVATTQRYIGGDEGALRRCVAATS